MRRLRFGRGLWVLLWVAASTWAFADGMVFPEVYYAKVEIPNQQALIHYSGGTERLVIETSFLGEGTNFAWVVPLPSPPEVRAVSENFFGSLRAAFQPRLVHRVNPYYAGILLVCGLAFLGARAMKDEVSCVVDLPLCLLLALGAGLIGKHAGFGFVTLGLALGMRIFARSSTIYALVLLMGTAFAAILVLAPNARAPHLIDTMGRADSGEPAENIAGVTVVSVQHAGVFESITIRGRSPQDVLEWLERNGYQTPKSAEPAIRQYIDRGWVFVASKARLGQGRPQVAALHPLAFDFSSPTAAYPTRLTAIGNRECLIDLYVFGDHRATARHFRTLRCDHLLKVQPTGKGVAEPGLRITEPEVLALIGSSRVGTKLSGRLSPAQMATADVEIKSAFFFSKGRQVYSRSGALTIALNLAVPLAAIGWFLVGLSEGGWKVNERSISRWRRRSLVAAAALGIGVFIMLPKVEVEIVRQPSREQDESAVPRSGDVLPSAVAEHSSPRRKLFAAWLPAKSRGSCAQPKFQLLD